MKEKIKYRKLALDLRAKLDLKKISTDIVHKISKLEVYQSAKTVMSYMAKDMEVSLSSLFNDGLKDWFLPVVDELHTIIYAARYIPGKTKLIKNKFNILEPEESKVPESFLLDVIFVPGLCFDKDGYRLGFGAGFYDKFLKLNPNSFKIGSCPKENLIDKLPRDSWDIKMDLVITD